MNKRKEKPRRKTTYIWKEVREVNDLEKTVKKENPQYNNDREMISLSSFEGRQGTSQMPPDVAVLCETKTKQVVELCL